MLQLWHVVKSFLAMEYMEFAELRGDMQNAACHLSEHCWSRPRLKYSFK